MGRMPKAPDKLALVRRYVVWSERSGGQRYMDLMGTNPLREDEPEHDAFTAALAEDARQISDADLSSLLEFEWRSRLTAAWLIGLGQRTQFRQALGHLTRHARATSRSQRFPSSSPASSGQKCPDEYPLTGERGAGLRSTPSSAPAASAPYAGTSIQLPEGNERFLGGLGRTAQRDRTEQAACPARGTERGRPMSV
jgi:hypothetical protein